MQHTIDLYRFGMKVMDTAAAVPQGRWPRRSATRRG